jgi:hypothetical protein
LQFSQFFIVSLFDVSQWKTAQKFFPSATRDEWLLQRDYAAIPPVEENWSGYGGIPNEVEDLLLLLRLYRPGDLAFVGIHIETPKNSGRQFPYYGVSELVGSHSTREFRFEESDCIPWEAFGVSLRLSPQWASSWFAAARRFLLYGGGKEFNPYHGDIGRVIDYVTAIEASIVPEADFVGRRLRERAVRLLGLEESDARNAKKLLSEMYGIRSTFVHGSAVDEKQMNLLKDRNQWIEFELFVRRVIVSALKAVPSDESGRRSYLTRLFDLSDEDRAEKLREDFAAIKDEGVKRELVDTLKRSALNKH